ncbi:stromal membrane-associated GTPase-activating protein 2 [Pelomyxa schiedti]|nr:stromal membrane-associated GTPase-activating protein 2 [Pelomyxa schiedti]
MATQEDIERMHALRNAAKNVVKATKKYEDSMKAYAADLGAVADELRNVSNLDKTSTFGRAITQLSGTLKSISGIHHTSATVMTQKFNGLSVFVDYDFLEFNESVKRLERLKSEYDALVAKIASGVKNVQGDPATLQAKIEECKLSVTKNLATLDSKRDTRLLATLLDGMEEYHNTNEKVSKVLALLKKKSLELTKHIEEINSQTTRAQKEGILVKRGKLGPNRIFVVLREGKIFQLHQNKEFNPNSALSVIMCTVRPVPEDNRKFEILSPQLKKSWQFEAESDTERNDWMKEIQNSIAAGLNSLSASSTSAKTAHTHDPLSEIAPATNFSTLAPREIDYLHTIPGNSTCVDCDSPAPDWASINLGVLMCLECSGVHRALGTHISKVRSLTLDKWNPDMLLYMKYTGNKKVNEILECLSPLPLTKPTAKSERALREQFIKSKYEVKKFVQQQSMSQDELNKALYISIQNSNADVKSILHLMVVGADPNWIDPEDNLSRSPLHHAVIVGSPLFLELLLQNGANPSVTDSKGWTALHYACFFNRPRAAMRLLQVCQKLLHITEESGVTPSDMAMWNESYDTVAVLKGCPLAKLDLSMDTVVNTPEVLMTDMGFEPKRSTLPSGPLSEQCQQPSLRRSSSQASPPHTPPPPGPPATPPPPAAPPSTPPPSALPPPTPPPGCNPPPPTPPPLGPPPINPSPPPTPPLSPSQYQPHRTPLATIVPLEEEEEPPPPPPPEPEPEPQKSRRKSSSPPPPPPPLPEEDAETAKQSTKKTRKHRKHRQQTEDCNEEQHSASTVVIPRKATPEPEEPAPEPVLDTAVSSDKPAKPSHKKHSPKMQPTQNQAADPEISHTEESNLEADSSPEDTHHHRHHSEHSAPPELTAESTESTSEPTNKATNNNGNGNSNSTAPPPPVPTAPKPSREKHKTQQPLSSPPTLSHTFSQQHVVHPLHSSSPDNAQRGIQIGARGRTSSFSCISQNP